MIYTLVALLVFGANETQQQRDWLLAHLIVDMQAQGQYDVEKYQKVEKMINNMSDSQINVLIEYYKQRKAEVKETNQQIVAKKQAVLQQAQINLEKAKAFRNYLLTLKLQYELQIRKQEIAITNWGSAIANSMFQNQLNNFMYQSRTSVFQNQSRIPYRGNYNRFYQPKIYGNRPVQGRC